MNFNALVMNVDENEARLSGIKENLSHLGLDFERVSAVIPSSLPTKFVSNMTPMAVAVWSTHVKCLLIASQSSNPTLVMEDDARLKITLKEIEHAIVQMQKHDIDFLQVGFLHLNIMEFLSIMIRNVYDKLVRHGLLTKALTFFGFREGIRAQNQPWRKELPSNFIINDVRFGGHCYIVTPSMANRLSQLNSPPFLAADDFYVSLSRMKSFRMARLKKSLAGQSGAPSSFKIRYGIDS